MGLEDIGIVFLCCQMYKLFLKHLLHHGLYTQIGNETGQYMCLLTLKYEGPKF